MASGTEVGDRFRIGHLLGRGAMGEVYHADDLKLGQAVALKFLPEHLEKDPEKLEGLLNEVRLARRIAHPNVCRVYDIGEADGRHFISMELIDGTDMRSLLSWTGRLSRERAVEIAHELCGGLAAAHEQGVLHRDLKPSNLMLDRDGRVRITDFGIATLIAGFEEQPERIGTPAYMAPEQLVHGEVSIQSDLFSLGLVLFELFTGERAFLADSETGLIRLYRAALPDPPSDRVNELDPAIDKIIQGCLERDPAARPDSALEVAASLPGFEDPEWRPAAGQRVPQRPNWVVEKKLGEGGFGEVWLARHQKTGERRVFKFCFDPERLRMLRREITFFRLLKEELGARDDIVRILDWEFDEEPYFIESEYVAGGSLPTWAEAQGGLGNVSLDMRLEIVAQVATALGAAHSVGVLHKDVKPANVLITSRDDGTVKVQLADFGAAHLSDRMRLTRAGITAFGLTTQQSDQELHGTLLYMAPEVLEGKPATVQADIYALGVMLYQVLVGDFHRSVAPGWDREIGDLLLREDIARAVDGSPDRRFGDAAQMAKGLRSLEGRRREHKKAVRAVAAARRRRLMAAALVVMAVFAGTVWFQAQRVAREAEARSQEAEARSQMAQFLVGLFEFSSPDRALGERITARQILDQGVRKINRELVDQPQIRARMLHTMGDVYGSLALYEEAVPLLEEALSTREALHGPDHLEVAESLDAQANLFRALADYEKAESLGRRALGMRRQLLGDDHPDVATSLETLAQVLLRKGELQEAEALYSEALAVRRRVGGAEDPETAKPLRGLAETALLRFDYEKAEAHYNEAFDIISKLGREHPDLARGLYDFALMYQFKGDVKEAEAKFREALEIRRSLYGEKHPEVAETLNNLAQVVGSQGRYEEAEEYFEEVLEIYRELNHPHVALVMRHLASLVYLPRGDYEKAETLLEESLQMIRDRFGEDDINVAFVSLQIGNLQRTRGAYEEALAFYQDASKIFFDQAGRDSLGNASVFIDRGDLFLESGDLERAESDYRQAYEIHQRLLGPRNRPSAYTLTSIAAVLIERGHFQIAETKLRGALDIFYEVYPTGNWQTSRTEAVLGSCLHGLGRDREAEELLLGAHQALIDLRGERSSETQDALRRLVDFYEGSGQAEKLRLMTPRTRSEIDGFSMSDPQDDQ